MDTASFKKPFITFVLLSFKKNYQGLLLRQDTHFNLCVFANLFYIFFEIYLYFHFILYSLFQQKKQEAEAALKLTTNKKNLTCESNF